MLTWVSVYHKYCHSDKARPEGILFESPWHEQYSNMAESILFAVPSLIYIEQEQKFQDRWVIEMPGSRRVNFLLYSIDGLN